MAQSREVAGGNGALAPSFGGRAARIALVAVGLVAVGLTIGLWLLFLSPAARLKRAAHDIGHRHTINEWFGSGHHATAGWQKIKAYGPSAVPVLVDLLQSRDGVTRWGAVEALGRFPAHAQRIIPALTRHLATRPDWKESDLIVQSLGSLIETADAEVPDELARMLDDEWTPTRCAATRVVLQVDPTNDSARYAALKALSNVPEPSTVGPEWSEDDAFEALRILDQLAAMPRGERSFARAAVDRIANFNPERVKHFTYLDWIWQRATKLVRQESRRSSENTGQELGIERHQAEGGVKVTQLLLDTRQAGELNWRLIGGPLERLRSGKRQGGRGHCPAA